MDYQNRGLDTPKTCWQSSKGGCAESTSNHQTKGKDPIGGPESAAGKGEDQDMKYEIKFIKLK